MSEIKAAYFIDLRPKQRTSRLLAIYIIDIHSTRQD